MSCSFSSKAACAKSKLDLQTWWNCDQYINGLKFWPPGAAWSKLFRNIISNSAPWEPQAARHLGAATESKWFWQDSASSCFKLRGNFPTSRQLGLLRLKILKCKQHIRYIQYSKKSNHQPGGKLRHWIVIWWSQERGVTSHNPLRWSRFESRKGGGPAQVQHPEVASYPSWPDQQRCLTARCLKGSNEECGRTLTWYHSWDIRQLSWVDTILRIHWNIGRRRALHSRKPWISSTDQPIFQLKPTGSDRLESSVARRRLA